MSNAHADGALLGLAVGDALGASLEFEQGLRPPRFPEMATGPHTEITGGGPWRLQPGQVTDDTAMACLLAAALRDESGGTRGEVERAVPLYLKWLAAEPPARARASCAWRFAWPSGSWSTRRVSRRASSTS